jgi:hypothetical protein
VAGSSPTIRQAKRQEARGISRGGKKKLADKKSGAAEWRPRKIPEARV